MQDGDEFQVILGIHVQHCQAAFDPLLTVGCNQGSTKNDLAAAFEFVTVCKIQFQIRQNHARQ